MQKGLSLHGDKREMSIRKPDSQKVMAFHPYANEPSIYWLNSKIVKNRKVLESLALSASIGYNLWHQ